MTWVWDQELPPNLKIVLLAIADHADDGGGQAFPSHATLARKTGYTDRQVKRIIDQLVSVGVLIVGKAALPGRRADRQPNMYRIRLDAPLAVSRDDLPKMSVDRDLRREVIDAFARSCYWCGVPGQADTDHAGSPWEIDRVVPGRQGGTYTRENVVLSCKSCNRKRRDILSPRGRNGGTSETERGDILSGNGGTPVSYKPSSEPSTEPPELFPSAPAPGPQRAVACVEAEVLTAREVTAHWVDTFRAVHSEDPPGQSVKRVAQAAKQLLDEGRTPDVVLAAAADAATGGHANLASAVTYALAKNKTHGRIAEPRGFAGIREFMEGTG